MNILFTCVGRRKYLLDYFRELQLNNLKIFATDMQLSAPALMSADVKIKVKGVYDKSYIPDLIDICKNNKIDMLISLNDLELPILSENKKILEETGVKVIVSSQSVIKKSFDKWETVKFIESNDLLTPKTFINLDSAISALKSGDVKFPLVVKPRWGSGSIGIEFPEDIEELEMSFKLQKKKIARTILSEASKDNIDSAILIQEKIEGKEFGVDIINDFETNYCATIVKEKLAMRSGETDKAITRNNPEIQRIGKIIGENLKHIGNLDCDILEKDGVYYVLELNPRFGGGYPFSHEAGANIPRAYINWLLRKDVPENDFKVGFDIAFSKCDNLIKL